MKSGSRSSSGEVQGTSMHVRRDHEIDELDDVLRISGVAAVLQDGEGAAAVGGVLRCGVWEAVVWIVGVEVLEEGGCDGCAGP